MVIALSGLMIVLGLRVGWYVITRTETDAITRAAQDYVQSMRVTGSEADNADCSARPAPGLAWLTVVCRPQDGSKTYRYSVDQWGRINRLAPR
ncbi:hypothetical protein [Pseudooceanicola sp. MF1-13]|uniref:hypothetical protein n=1 Tax=Pseudooceanicola sp. MF1-13 TaxID=3379095 RepID=UPI0038911B9D